MKFFDSWVAIAAFPLTSGHCRSWGFLFRLPMRRAQLKMRIFLVIAKPINERSSLWLKIDSQMMLRIFPSAPIAAMPCYLHVPLNFWNHSLEKRDLTLTYCEVYLPGFLMLLNYNLKRIVWPMKPKWTEAELCAAAALQITPSIAAVWEFDAVSVRCCCWLKKRNFLMTAKWINERSSRWLKIGSELMLRI